MASSLIPLRTLFIVLLIGLSFQLVKPERLDLKDNLKSLFDLFDEDFNDNTDDGHDDDNGYARDGEEDRYDGDENPYGDDTIDDEDMSRLGTVPPLLRSSTGDTRDSYDSSYNNGNESPYENGFEDDENRSRLETVPPSSWYDTNDDEGDTSDSYDSRYNNGNESPNENGFEDDENRSRLETVPPSSWYDTNDDEGDTSDSYDSRYNNGNESPNENGLEDDENRSRLETVPPSSRYDMISDVSTLSTDWMHFANNDMQGTESPEGNEGVKGNEALLPEQRQQQEWQEQQPNQENDQREAPEEQEQTQQQEQQQQQQQYQTGEQQQQTALDSSVIANYSDTHQNSSASLSSENEGLPNTPLSSASSDQNSDWSESEEQSNPLCSIELNLYDLCSISLYREASSYPNPFTFSLLENTISHNTTRQSLKRCQLGDWCLGTNVIEDELENFPRHLCQSPLLVCLKNIAEQIQVCTTYQKYSTILSSLGLVCEYFNQDTKLEHVPQCGVRLFEMISVTLSDMEREIPQQVQESDPCKSRSSLMQSSFRCLINGCNALEKTTVFRSFPPWQWFLVSLNSNKQCPLNCSRGNLFENRVYAIEESFVEGSTRSTLVTQSVTITPLSYGDGEDAEDAEDAANLQYNSNHKSEQTGRSIHFLHSWNIGFIAASVATLLIVVFTIVVALIWRRLKDHRNMQNLGYSKLKTGEC